jgi:predicted small integral membrane protein
MSMARHSSARSVSGAALAAGLVTLLLGGCALIQPPPVPRVPRLGLGASRGDAMCVGDIGQAHAALAAAGAAAGDPAATAAAHAAAAAAMSAYHACLAQPRP